MRAIGRRREPIETSGLTAVLTNESDAASALSWCCHSLEPAFVLASASGKQPSPSFAHSICLVLFLLTSRGAWLGSMTWIASHKHRISEHSYSASIRLPIVALGHAPRTSPSEWTGN